MTSRGKRPSRWIELRTKEKVLVWDFIRNFEGRKLCLVQKGSVRGEKELVYKYWD